MSNNEVAVIIPFYKTELTKHEKIALTQCGKVLSNYPIIAVSPHTLSLPKLDDIIAFAQAVTFDNKYFESIAGYNNLMMSSDFYHKFLDFKYILIYQADCFVFKDELTFWCKQGFDYIGSPWIKKSYHKNQVERALRNFKDYMLEYFSNTDNNRPNQYQLNNKVGNGGFSLRRVKAFYDICISMQPVINLYLANPNNYYNEDVFWSIEVNRERRILSIPPLEVGLRFAFEVPPFKFAELNANNLPFGCHDWDNYLDFWRPFIVQQGYSLEMS
ncbi:DUF5672 family protein [Mucilaginibacter antarcticus]|uniref:DUF5672 family protein n=1 Tax=Mucilaginibacter antarcticus TaxID=1855725 RepID=A0ABW5XLU0_9SPHI